MRDILRREINGGSVTMWLGFDNREHIRVHGELYSEDVQLVERAFRHFMCWKALLYVQTHDWGTTITVLKLGSGGVFTACLKHTNYRVMWIKNDEFLEKQIRELFGW